MLDIRLANADRHAGNILVCRDDQGRGMSLVPIDHGYCLPESVSSISLSIARREFHFLLFNQKKFHFFLSL